MPIGMKYYEIRFDCQSLEIIPIEYCHPPKKHVYKISVVKFELSNSCTTSLYKQLVIIPIGPATPLICQYVSLKLQCCLYNSGNRNHIETMFIGLNEFNVF